MSTVVQPGYGYLLDTNIASAAWDEGDPNHVLVLQRLSSLGTSPVFISVVSLAEVEYGLKTAPNIDSVRQTKVRQNMAMFDPLPIDDGTVEAYSSVRAKLFVRYSPVNKRGRLTRKTPESLVW